VSKQDDELMGLYAIVRDEIEGVHEACEKLQGLLGKLDNVTNHIHYSAKNGVESSLSDFKKQFDVELREKVSSASIGLKNASNEAINSLGRQEKLYWVIFFIAGMLVGGFGLCWWMSDRFYDLEIGQKVLYNKIESLRHPVKSKKAL
jgi:hypothetical protein